MTREQLYNSLIPVDIEHREYVIDSRDYENEPIEIEKYAFVVTDSKTNEWSGIVNSNDLASLIKFAKDTYWFDNSKIIDLDTNQVVFENHAITTAEKNNREKYDWE